MTYNEIINKKPSANYNVELETRTQGEIKMNGGNDYQLNALDNSTSRSELKKVVVAYSDGENLYMNSKVLKLQTWYSKVLSDKKYFVFSAALPENIKEYGIEISDLPKMFGGLGGAFQAMKLALLRFPYIMEKSTQKITLVSDKNIKDFIGNDSILLEKYEKELEKNNMEIILNYLVEWDKKQ